MKKTFSLIAAALTIIAASLFTNSCQKYTDELTGSVWANTTIKTVDAKTTLKTIQSFSFGENNSVVFYSEKITTVDGEEQTPVILRSAGSYSYNNNKIVVTYPTQQGNVKLEGYKNWSTMYFPGNDPEAFSLVRRY